LFVLPMQKAEALSFTPSNMAIATKVVRGIGERLGVKWSKDSLLAVVGYLAGQSDTAGHEPILPFWWLFGTTPDTIPLDDDKSLVRLTPDDFKGGSKAIKDAVDAVVPGAVVPIYGQCYKYFYNNSNVLLNAPDWHWITGYNAYLQDFVMRWHNVNESLATRSYLSGSTSAPLVGMHGATNNIIREYWRNQGGTTGWVNVYGSSAPQTADTVQLTSSKIIYGSTEPIYTDSSLTSLYYDNADKKCDYTVVTGDVSNITYVTNNMWNTTTNNYNYYPDYPVTIINVGDGTEDIDVPVNPPMTPEETGNISDPPPPPPPDTDGDGIPDSTDITPGGETPTPDDTGIFAKLFPILLILKLFGVLGSCLMYLLRMFEFIMTIPGIDAIPIDNTAFDWFRNASIVGIKIYDVVTSLASVGLSFIVFRAIRRAYL
jgi:hypothetical protein